MIEKRLFESGVHASHRLIKHHHIWSHHQSSRHFEQLPLAARERSSELIAHMAEFESFKQCISTLSNFGFLATPQEWQQCSEERFSGLFGSAKSHVVNHRHLRQRFRQLEGAHHAKVRNLVRRHPREVVSLEKSISRIGLIKIGQQIEERGLAGAVRADQRGDRSALHLKVLDINSDETTKRTPNIVGDENWVILRSAWFVRDAIEELLGGGRFSGHRAPSPLWFRKFLEVGRSPTK